MENEEKFTALQIKGDEMFKHERYIQALTHYSDALNLKNEDEDVLGCRSAVYAKLGMFNESKKDAEKLIAVVPEKPKGHFLRAIALEHLGNFQECLLSYLKTYELDIRHPPELLLNIVQAAGCLCQLSDTEEVDLSTADEDAEKFKKLVHVGKRFYEDGRHHLCIRVILTALKSHYNLSEENLYPEVTVDASAKETSPGKSKAIFPGVEHGICDCAENSTLSPIPALSSAYIRLNSHDDDNHNEEQVSARDSFPYKNAKVLMSGFLALAQAFFDIKKFVQASKFSKQCLSAALNFKSKEYEIKAYVKLANTYHRQGDYLQAISTNAKLLAVGRDLSNPSGDAISHQEYWNSDVERRAVWNLSAAYKFLGNYEQALYYANEYIEVLKYIDQENLTEAYSYLGELELLHGNHEKALECHKVELRLCKRFRNRSGMAYAYGNLGNVYATMGNFKVASVFHEQHKMLARSLSDRVSELVAIKHSGDMCKLMGEFPKALVFYDEHLKLAKINNMEVLQCKAYGHIGSCLWELGQLHHAQYNFSLCLKMASELGQLEEESDCKLSLAQITKRLRQYETCRQYYNDVIPALEDKLLAREGQSAAYKAKLLGKLEGCYVELQEALIEMGRPDEALEIAEHCRSRCYVSIFRRRQMFTDNTPDRNQALSALALSDIIEIVNKQDAALVLYSVIHSGYLVWVLSPGKGVVKFHHHKTCKHFNLEESIKHCVEGLHSDSKNTYNCDHRALPRRRTIAHVEQAVDKRPVIAWSGSCSSCEFLVSDALTPLQKAYKILLAPIEEELTALSEERRKLVFIPDSILNSVPFPCLQTLSGGYLHEMFKVRVLPCIRALSLQTQTTSDQTPSSDEATERCKVVVAGNPDISTVQLGGEVWKPNKESDLTEQEITTIASLLGVDPIIGPQATKDCILSSLSEASVVHLATFGSWAEGCLALAPNPHHHGNPPPEESFLVTSSDLLQLTLKTKLVVLSACCGCGRHYCQLKQVNFNLATALLACGVQAVVLPLWSTPHSSLMNLFYHFYSALEQGKTVSESLTESWEQLKSVEIFSAPDFWASHVLFGFDGRVDLPHLRHQLFDKVLDEVVKEQTFTRFPVMTPALLDSKVQPVSVKVEKLKVLLSNLMIHHNDFPCVVPAVTDLVRLACQMLAACHDPELPDDVTMCAQLSSEVLLSPHIRDCLSFLDFDLQKDGAKDEDPFVVFPHWDYDGTLEVAKETLQAVHRILQVSPAAGCAFARILKALTKNSMEKLREILSITAKYPERIMKTSDFVLRSLWYSPDMQRYLTAIGFFEVGQSLLFKKSEDNQTLLKATFNTVSALLTYCENENARTAAPVRELTSRDGRPVRLTTLSPRLASTKQIVMGTPWMSKKADADESALKVKLARELETINKAFAGRVTKSNYWHAQLLRNQSAPGTSLPVIGKSPRDSRERPKSRQNGKIKVASGLTPSCNRTPVDPEPMLSITDTRERRNEIYGIYARRYDDIAMRKRHEIRHLFISQVTDKSG